MKTKLPFRFCLAWLTALGVLLVGCQSGKQPGSTSHASVLIAGRSADEIQQAVTTVFQEAGYGVALSLPTQMVFERPGSRRDAIKWGDIGGGGVNLRVKVQFSTIPDGRRLVQADAYAVQVSDDPFFQSESRNVLLNRRPYQKLLDEAARRLK